jgi:hypothetical protein
MADKIGLQYLHRRTTGDDLIAGPVMNNISVAVAAMETMRSDAAHLQLTRWRHRSCAEALELMPNAMRMICRLRLHRKQTLTVHGESAHASQVASFPSGPRRTRETCGATKEPEESTGSSPCLEGHPSRAPDGFSGLSVR